MTKTAKQQDQTLREKLEFEESEGIKKGYFDNELESIKLQQSGKFIGSMGFIDAGCEEALSSNPLQER